MERKIEEMVSKEHFEAYVDLQKSGIINMLDIIAGPELSGIPKNIYILIIKNYSYLKRIYGRDN